MVVSKISFSSASIKRIAVDSNGDEMESGKSVLLELLENPNNQQGSIEFYDEINEYLSLTGNAFVRYVSGIGGIGVELKILAADRVDIITNGLGMIVKYRFTDFDGRVFDFDGDEVLHIKTSNVVDQDRNDRLFGLSPLDSMKPVIEASNEKFSAEASIFKNRGMIGFVSNDTDVPMLEDERLEAQNSFDRGAGGSSKFNSIFVTNTRLRFVQTGMSPTDLKLLDGIVSSLRLICARYSMPSILFNDTEKSTYNNFEQAIKVSYNDVYIPLANKVDRSLSPWLSKKLGVEETIKADLTSIEVIKSSTNEVAQALNSLDTKIVERIMENMTQDEVRALGNLGVLPIGTEVLGAKASTSTQNIPE
jgi:HK97 family phage portal protein